MSKKRKISSGIHAMKVEVKEENPYGDDVLIARGRLKGALRDLLDHSGSGSESDFSDEPYKRYGSASKKMDASRKRRRSETAPVSFHHTYVMKLFDRSVDLARFGEDTPLYPICRAWMANQPRNPQAIVKRRYSSPDPVQESWNGEQMVDVYTLPPPVETPIYRVPSPIPEQKLPDKDGINLNYDEKSAVPRETLLRDHLQRWAKVKQKWINTANKNEDRFQPSTQILTTIYQKAQEGME